MLDVNELKIAVESLHHCSAQYTEQAEVEDVFDGEQVWSGTIATFTLANHPTASACYAWKETGRIFAVLQSGPVDSPLNALRASILSDYHS